MKTLPVNKLATNLDLQTVRAFAGTLTTNSLVAYPSSVDECRSVVEYARDHNLTICPRGKGYTYADMILNNDHILLNLTKMNKVLNFDTALGQITVEPGVKFADVFQVALPENWTLGSCPGGMYVTIGGALSNDVHGKDSWRIGNFGDQVLEFKLLKADGQIITVNRKDNAEIFQAAVGGMGLLGIIVEVTLQLHKIPSAFVEVTTIPTKNIEESLRILEDSRAFSDFSIAWVDAFATKQSLGRGFVTYAKWINSDEPLDQHRLKKSLTMSKRVFDIFPSKPFWALLRPIFTPGFLKFANVLMYYKAKLRGKYTEKKLFTEFNFMHNRIPDMNHVYDPEGFLEFEPLVPKDEGLSSLKEILNLCQEHKSQSLLCGVKIHADDDGMLSFAGDGYSIGIDIQLKNRKPEEVKAFSDKLFEYVHKKGGSIYLGKDERLPSSMFKKMYKRYEEYLDVKQQCDPEGLFCSDMFRRLFEKGQA